MYAGSSFSDHYAHPCGAKPNNGMDRAIDRLIGFADLKIHIVAHARNHWPFENREFWLSRAVVAEFRLALKFYFDGRHEAIVTIVVRGGPGELPISIPLRRTARR